MRQTTHREAVQMTGTSETNPTEATRPASYSHAVAPHTAAPTAVAKSSSQAAVDEKGLDQRRSLAAADGQPLQQLRPGTQVTLTFPAGAAPAGTRHSAFLRTRGYYEHIRSYEGLPNLPELYAFRKPGRFVEFSKERYREATRQLNLTALQR